MPANKKSPTGDAAPKGAMPEMPNVHTWVPLEEAEIDGMTTRQAEAYGRACYLAGIADAKKEVMFGPSTPFDESDYERGCARGWEMYREQVTANLTALERQVNPVDLPKEGEAKK